MPTSLDHQERMLPDWLDYDPAGKYVTVDGFKISRGLLTQITTSPPGVRYRIIERKDGCITVGYERDPLEAAAPAMLAALKATRIYVETLEKHLDPVTDPAAPTIREHGAMLRAAIAKAEGI